MSNHTLFQFHNGSIKRQDEHAKSLTLTEFQFHNGSIKSENIGLSNDPDDRFQFHNGSIKRVLGSYASC